MTLHNRPGITLAPVRPSRRVQGLARGDVPVIIGYATRGPVMEPVRVESLRQVEAIFGPPLPGVHLFDAVKGFFETGGRCAYVLRIVGPGARAAGAVNNAHWQIRARTALTALGPVDGPVETVADVLPWFDHLRRIYGLALPDPGAWANDLSLTLTERARVRVQATVATPTLLRPQSMTGLTAHGLLRLNGATIAQIASVDAARGAVNLVGPVPFAVGTDLAVQAVTFDAEIVQRGQRLELFSDLHLVPEHPASIAARLNRKSLSLSLEFTGPDPDWTDQSLWPATGIFTLSAGTADLAGLTAQTWFDGLTAQARVDEIALVAAPDLVRQPVLRRTDLRPSLLAVLNCDDPAARPRGAIAGVVRDGATGLPVAGCQVLAAGEGGFALTDADGFFFMGGLSLTLIDLRLSAPGFEDLETFLQSSTAAQKFYPKIFPLPVNDPALALIDLIAIDDIASFDADEVVKIQQAMLALMGDYRVAVLDPPAPAMSPEALLNWRAQLGQDARLFAVAPWLEVPLDSGLVEQPPSGHICGAFARAELAQGVHRAPANIPLRHAKHLTLDLDEPMLAAFHAASLNPLRSLPGQGLRLMGSRSLSGDFDWQQVSVRRLFDAIEKTLAAQLAWSVFEPNSATTRAILKFSVEQFLETLRKRGMFAGATAAQAYSVACDGGNNTPDSAARGELFIDIGIAPTKPYEFISFSLTAQAEAIEVTEAT